MKNVLFVTGTDTGVGKTVVTTLIALKMRQMSIQCGVLKPFASGCLWKNGVLTSEDAEFHQKALGLTDSHSQIAPLCLEEALAPLLAARRAGISTARWPEIARDALEVARQRYDWVIVEGAGGILAPLWEKEGQIGSNRDLINLWGVPVIVVARRALGTINHTLLTLNTSVENPAYFAGIVFNDPFPLADDDLAAQSGVAFLREQTPVPIWGVVPFKEKWDGATLSKTASALKIEMRS